MVVALRVVEHEQQIATRPTQPAFDCHIVPSVAAIPRLRLLTATKLARKCLRMSVAKSRFFTSNQVVTQRGKRAQMLH
jgi:hypothetical protein